MYKNTEHLIEAKKEELYCITTQRRIKSVK